MTILLVILYVLVCLFLIMVVLLQQGKGADLAGAFGGGGSQTSFGPRSGTNIMHRLTTVSFVLFVVLSLALAILSGKARSSVMEEVPVAAPVTVEQGAGEPEMVPGGDQASPEEGAQPAPVEAAGDDGAAPVQAEEPPPPTE